MSTDPVREFSIAGSVSEDAEVASISGASLLDSLKAEMSKAIDVKPITLAIPMRAGWEAEYEPKIESTQINAWRKASRDKSFVDGIDDIKFCALILANTNSGISSDGVFAELEDGDRATFRSRELWPDGVIRAVDGIREMFGRDADIAAHAEQVMRAAGYDPDGEDLIHPTTR